MAGQAGGAGWRDYHKRVRSLQGDIPRNIARLIEGHDARVLLLGVTRDLAGLGTDLTAVDWCPEQIAKVWIGDRSDRRAIEADWRDMELPRSDYTAAIGDGSLSTLSWPDDYRLVFERLAEALEAGGRVVVRCFVSPDVPETVEQVAADVRAGAKVSFFAARWRIAMALAGSGNIAVREICYAFDRAFPDRHELAVQTGWEPETISLIDAYRDSALVFSFVNRADLLATLTRDFTNPRFLSSGDYPMSERYPLLVAERR